MIVQRLERPIDGILDLADAKRHCRVDDDFEDPDFQRMMVSAIIEAEDYAAMAFRYSAVRVTLDARPPGGLIRLPIGPLRDWTAVNMTVAGEDYEDFTVITGSRPSLRLDTPCPAGAIAIEYVAGFAELGAEVPDDIRHALLDQVAAYYDARGASKEPAISPHFARIIGRYRGVRA